jgi:hypothetical protein
MKPLTATTITTNKPVTVNQYFLDLLNKLITDAIHGITLKERLDDGDVRALEALISIYPYLDYEYLKSLGIEDRGENHSSGRSE